MIIQVKNYGGTLGPSPALEQLEMAHDNYSKEGTLLSLFVMTTADAASPEFIAGAKALAIEWKIPVKAILKKQMMKIMAEGLLLSKSGDESASTPEM